MTQAVGYRDQRLRMATDTFKLADGDKLCQCPYNKSHHILESSFKTHLEKCRRSYPITEMGVCKFNAQHHIPLPELAYHHQLCADMKTVIHDAAESNRDNPNPLESADRILSGASECWDVDECTGYDPKKKIEKNPQLLHLPPGTSRSQRKEHLQQKKLLIEEKAGQSPILPNTNTAPYADSCTEDEEIPLSSLKLEERPTGSMPPLPRPVVNPNAPLAPLVNGNIEQPIGRGKGRKIAANIFGNPGPAKGDAWSKVGREPRS